MTTLGAKSTRIVYTDIRQSIARSTVTYASTYASIPNVHHMYHNPIHSETVQNRDWDLLSIKSRAFLYARLSSSLRTPETGTATQSFVKGCPVMQNGRGSQSPWMASYSMFLQPYLPGPNNPSPRAFMRSEFAIKRRKEEHDERHWPYMSQAFISVPLHGNVL